MTVYTKAQIEDLMGSKDLIGAVAYCLARTALALHRQLADARAARALVVERAEIDAALDAMEANMRAAGQATIAWRTEMPPEDQDKLRACVRAGVNAAFADPSGVEALATLRAERDALNVRYDDLYADALADAKSDAQDFEGELWKAIRSILDDFDYDWSGDALEDGVTANEAAEFIRDTLDGETMRADTAIAERDALAAKLAAAEARVGALKSLLRKSDDALDGTEVNLNGDDVFRSGDDYYTIARLRTQIGAALAAPTEETKG